MVFFLIRISNLIINNLNPYKMEKKIIDAEQSDALCNQIIALLSNLETSTANHILKMCINSLPYNSIIFPEPSQSTP